MTTFGERLRELRKELDKEPSDIGKIVGLSGSSIEKYESNDRTPSPKTLNALANYFGVTVDYLLGNTDVRSSNKKTEINGAKEAPVLYQPPDIFSYTPEELAILEEAKRYFDGLSPEERRDKLKKFKKYMELLD